MNKYSSIHQTALEEQAVLLTGEIFRLIDEYTIDSNISKFFLTDEIAIACFGLAGSFVSPCYFPDLSPFEIKDTQIISFFYSLMTYGFNLFLKERSLTTEATPYTIESDKRIIRRMRKNLLEKISRGEISSTPLADEVIGMLLRSIKHNVDLVDFSVENHKLSKKKFYDYVKLSLYWGYNFASHVLVEKPRIYR